MDYLQQAYFSNLHAVCRDGGRFTLQPGQTWRITEHISEFNKFYFFLSGRCRISVEDRVYHATGGDWFYIPAGVRHSYTDLPGETFDKHWIHFELYPNGSLPRLLQLPHFVRGNQKSSQLFETLTACNASNKLTDKLHAKVSLMALIAEYLECSHISDLPVLSEEDSRIAAVLSYIHNHLAQPLHNKLLADLCHLHPNHFIRFFSRKTGQSPASYILKCRMDLARQLLIETDLPVQQIAEQTGFQDQSHFARLFRRCHEMSPTQCRKQHKA